jgi:hypothetical protein
MYLRFVHAISYQRLSRLLLELFGLAISEGALDAAFRRGRFPVSCSYRHHGLVPRGEVVRLPS